GYFEDDLRMLRRSGRRPELLAEVRTGRVLLAEGFEETRTHGSREPGVTTVVLDSNEFVEGTHDRLVVAVGRGYASCELHPSFSLTFSSNSPDASISNPIW